MTDLLEKAIAIVKTLPADRQDDLAHLLLAYIENDHDIVALTPDEEVDVVVAEEEAARGALATDEEIHAIWAKYKA